MGVSPTVADDDDGGAADAPESPDADAEMAGEDADGEPPDEPEEMAEVELSDDDVSDGAADDLFTGTEDADAGGDESDESDESDDETDAEGDGSGLLGDDLDGRAGRLEGRVNESLARMAVVGLGDDYKMADDDDDQCLEAEFRDIFDLAGVGHYSAEVVDEYVLTADQDDVNPAWGLLGSVAVCAALAVYMRPDGDEKLTELKDTVAEIGGLA